MTALKQAEIEAVSALPREERVEYLVKRVVGHETIWGIKEGDWVTSMNSSDLTIFNVWPFEAYAQRYCVGEWDDCVPEAMSLAVLMDTFLPSLDEQGIAVGVFYTPTDDGVLMPPLDLAQRLREYEDTWY
jgi:hypothetical protein